MTASEQTAKIQLPGLNCGSCGFRTCEDFGKRLERDRSILKRCTFLSSDSFGADKEKKAVSEMSAVRKDETTSRHSMKGSPSTCPSSATCGACAGASQEIRGSGANAFAVPRDPYLDSLGREFDFYLEHFPEDPGPREIIIPHNPMITRELDIKIGDTLIGRPLGMSCGCPITHCGHVIEVDHRTGVLTWCVTGPLGPREKGYKDLGYYIAEAYEGIASDPRKEIKIGMRYFFQPRMCMLQWRHSGLVNYINKSSEGLQIRIEGLWIG